MGTLRALILIPVALIVASPPARCDWTAPPGFEVSEFAGPDLADDLYTLAFDERGRVTVSGKGFIRILEDTDDDGRADRSTQLFDGPRDGAMGLFWEGSTLYFTGDGALRRIHDADADGAADATSELVAEFKTGSEHGTHAVRRGPDGWLYVLCGNESQIGSHHASTAASPVQSPVAGALVRFSPDFSQSEVVADGFRNPYDFDFTEDGEIFTYDADNERCVTLPWYEPTRLDHVVPGRRHGWENPQHAVTWKSPAYWFDRNQPILTLGRGSPTGVECYREDQFPARYRGGLFLADWTFGLIHFVELQPDGPTYTATSEVFLSPEGNLGYAPTDLAVHPLTGDLFVSIGGRGTRGGVYRVRWTGTVEPDAGSPLDAPPERSDLHALLDAARHKAFGPETERIVARTWGSEDRLIRWACSQALAADPRVTRWAAKAQGDRERSVAAWAMFEADRAAAARTAADIAAGTDAAWVRLEAVRLLQVYAGDVGRPTARGTIWEGYTRRPEELLVPESLLLPVLDAFPTGDAELDGELSRLAALVEWSDEDFKARVAARWTGKSHPAEDVHYLAVFARLGGERSQPMIESTASALIDLDRKIEEGGHPTERNWPARVGEIAALLMDRDTRLGEAILSHPSFGRPGHVLLTKASGMDRRRAAVLFLGRAREENFPWSSDLVQLVGDATAEGVADLLREKWENAGLKEAILRVLARTPADKDWEKFREGLLFPSPQTRRICVEALERLPAPCGDPARLSQLIRVLQRLSRLEETRDATGPVSMLLSRCLPNTPEPGSPAEWGEWFATAHPGHPPVFEESATGKVDWKARLNRLNWESGDSERGREFAERIGCMACHSGARSLGPDLAGIGERFGRDDLFRSIFEPERDVSDRYRTRIIETDDGLIHQGVVIYESVDNVLLQTGADDTVRIPGDAILSTRPSNSSLMPSGMLDLASDQEIVDLYRYLMSL